MSARVHTGCWQCSAVLGSARQCWPCHLASSAASVVQTAQPCITMTPWRVANRCCWSQRWELQTPRRLDKWRFNTGSIWLFSIPCISITSIGSRNVDTIHDPQPVEHLPSTWYTMASRHDPSAPWSSHGWSSRTCHKGSYEVSWRSPELLNFYMILYGAKQLPKPEALLFFVEPCLFFASLWSCQWLTLERWLLLEEAIWNLKQDPVETYSDSDTRFTNHIIEMQNLLLANLKTTICLSGKGDR